MKQTLYKSQPTRKAVCLFLLTAPTAAGAQAPSAPAASSAASTAPGTAPGTAPVTAPVTAPPTAPPPERWAGRQTVLGLRSIPLLGDFETRTDIWLLAEIVRTADRWEVRQTTCDVRVADVAGVSITFPRDGIPRMPATSFRVLKDADGFFFAPTWSSGWDARDHDRDGWPGLTLSISAPLCSGRLAVVSDTKTTAQVRRATTDALELDLAVRVGQTIAETEGWCLALADEQTDDRFHGKAVYQPLSPTAGCADILRMPPALPPTED